MEQRKVGRAAPAKETAERILHGSAVLGVCVGGGDGGELQSQNDERVRQDQWREIW